MIGWIEVTIVIIIVLCLSYLETRSIDNPLISFSPFKLLAIPYICILLFQQLCISLYSFKELSPLYIISLIIHFLIVWIIDISFLRKRDTIALSDSSQNEYTVSDRVEKILAGIGIIIALLSIIYFFRSASSLTQLGRIVQLDFQTEYKESIGGLETRLIAMIASVYFFSVANKNKKINYIYGLLCLIPNLLTFVKSVIFMNVIASVIGHAVINKTKLTARRFIAIGLSGVFVLYFVYLVEICIWDVSLLFKSDTYSFIFGKLVKYLDAGVQAFNIEIENGIKLFSAAKSFEGQDNIIFAPVANLLSKIGIVHRINTVNTLYTQIGTLPGIGVMTSNVFTYIGQMVLYCGLFGSLIVEVIISCILNIYYVLAIKQKNIIFLIIYSIFGSFFALGWFDDYFTQTFWGYLIIISLIVSLFSKTKTSFSVPRIHFTISTRRK